MPLDVTMPDGTLFKDIPEGTTKQQILDKFRQYKTAQIKNVPEYHSSIEPASDVALGQANAVGEGALGIITGIPGALRQGAGALYQALSGGGTGKGMEMLSGAIHQYTDPVTTSARGAAALVAPDSVTAPSREEWQSAAQGAGALGAQAAGGILGKAATAERLQGTANTARDFRAANPLSSMDITKPMSMVKPVAGAAAGIAAPGLEKLARARTALDRSPTAPPTPTVEPGQYPSAPATQPTTGIGYIRTAPQATVLENRPPLPSEPSALGQFPGQPETPTLGVERPAPSLASQQMIQQAEQERIPVLGESRVAGPRQDIEMPNQPQPTPVTPPPSVDPVAHIEQSIAPRGAEQQATTIRISQDLAKDPVLSNTPPGPAFDRALHERFTSARAELQAAGQSVKPGTVVAKAPLMDDLAQEIAHQSSFSSQPDIVANSAARRILGDWYNKLDKLPAQIPFDELRDFRQSLDREIQSHGGWSETASSADRAEMGALRNVANAVRARLKGVSARLDAADAAYGPASDAVGAAGLDWKTGRRLSNVGKIPPTPKVTKAKQFKATESKRMPGGPL